MDRAEARGRILDAAQMLFARHGFDATATRRIAEEARVPAGLVFYYFPSKQALLDQLVAERSFLAELEQILRAAPPSAPRDTLRDLGRRFLEVVTRREAIARILMRESPTHPRVAERWRHLRETAVAIIANYLAAATEGGRRPAMNAQLVARVFLYTLIGVALVDGTRPSDAWLGEVVDALIPDPSRTAP